MIYVGCAAGGMVTNEGQVPGPGARVVQIDIDPRELGRNYPVIAAIQSDARAALIALAAASTARRGRASSHSR